MRLRSLVCRAFLTVGIAAGLTRPVEAQNQIRGRIRDEDGRPVTFAQVQVVPGDRRIVADDKGEFVITGFATGDYELRVKRIGFEPTSVTVHVPSDEGWIPITMRPLPRVLDSVRIRERASYLRYTGIVVDDFDQPVPDAQIIAAGASDLNVRTNSEGLFRLLKPQKGTLVLRVRKFGYTPYFGSLTFRAEREDTIRLKRLATDLPEAFIRAESGFGKDSFAFIELDTRTRWKLSSGGMVSREELDQFADLDLCQAVMRTALAGKMGLRESACSMPQCLLIDGLQPLLRPMNAFLASEVEAFEYHQKDWSGTIAARLQNWCSRAAPRGGGGMVVWLRKRQP